MWNRLKREGEIERMIGIKDKGIVGFNREKKVPKIKGRGSFTLERHNSFAHR